ncbi:MAG TPA: Ig-like domain-containing protein, partial [Longimicrobium sp.]|nr:Ig-like domain-containing protein [Longimicrobium sp.]
MLRWTGAGAAMLLAAACAHIEAPTGGPTDSIAPALVATRPDTNAVLPGWTGPAIFVFDEGLSEEGVDEAVTLSPRRGAVAVDKEGDEIRVQPRRGWQPGTIYQVEVAPGLKDRFGNAIRTPSRLVFSTGPAIPDTRASGVVRDRITGTPSLQARVDALRLGDSLLYSTVSDSAGRYTFSQVPAGEYQVIAYRDANRNFRVDAFEQRDTAALTLVAGQAPSANFALLPNDTTAPVAGSARVTDGWVEIRFDDYLDPDQTVAPEQVSLIGPEGAVAIAEVRIGPPPAAARDTGAAAADSAGPVAGQRPAAGQRPVARDTAGADTTAPTGPLPFQALFARPATELLPDTLYTVRVSNVRNVNGLVGGGEVPLRTPRPAPPRPAATPA